MNHAADALAVIPHIDFERWRAPGPRRDDASGFLAGQWRLRIVTTIALRAQAAGSEGDGTIKLTTRTLAAAVGCSPHVLVGYHYLNRPGLIRELWVNARVIDYTPGKGRAPSSFRLTDPSNPDYWREVPWRPGFDPADRLRDPLSRDWPRRVATFSGLAARLDEASRATTNSYGATVGGESRDNVGECRDSPPRVARQEFSFLPSDDALSPSVLNLKALSTDQNPEREREAEQETDKLARLITCRTNPPYPLAMSQRDRIRALVDAGHPLDAVTDRLRQLPAGWGPPLVLDALEANGYETPATYAQRVAAIELADACGRCDRGWLLDDDGGMATKCDHGAGESANRP